MKIPILFAALTMSVFAQSPVTLDLEREISHVLLRLPERSIFDTIQFQLRDNNKVILDGQVTNDLVKQAAERDLNATAGVGQVIDNLKVHPLYTGAGDIRNDVFHAMEAEPELERHAHRSVWPIHVIVNQSVVTLEGIVNSDAAKTEAGVAADSVPAVSSVINHLRVVPFETSTTQSTNDHNSTLGEQQ